MNRHSCRFAPLLVLALAAAACDTQPRESAATAETSRAPAAPAQPIARNALPPCDPDNGGLTLPQGFCAVVVADDVSGEAGDVRHVAVAPNGDVYVAVQGSRGAETPSERGRIVALRDTTGDGKADVRARFGPEGGTGLRIHDGFLYFAPNDRVLRYRLDGTALEPSGPPETLVEGLPDRNSHTAKTLAFADGAMYVNIGAPTNACQPLSQDREAGVPGLDPCPQLEDRAGVWRFDANRTGQRQSDGVRWATGVRNAVALAVNPADGTLYAVQHGRDQLGQWPGYSAEDNANKPTEEMFRLARGTDGGWPYCYYDPAQNRKVLAPEYGGNGREVGRCADKAQPVVTFPAHWAPNDLLFYSGTHFPEAYRGGAFIAWHGSWNRAPLPQAGYKVSFVPMRGGESAGEPTTFADGFTGPTPQPGTAEHRPMGLAQGPDGSLYIADSSGGRIWRVMYTGSR